MAKQLLDHDPQSIIVELHALIAQKTKESRHPQESRNDNAKPDQLKEKTKEEPVPTMS